MWATYFQGRFVQTWVEVADLSTFMFPEIRGSFVSGKADIFQLMPTFNLDDYIIEFVIVACCSFWQVAMWDGQDFIVDCQYGRLIHDITSIQHMA